MDWTEASLETFRYHRHDVQNALQLIRGYIQLNRPNQAIEVVDGLSSWLHSLTLISNLGPEASPWVNAAAQCPHVVLTELSGGRSASLADYEALADSWRWFDGAATEQAIRSAKASVHFFEESPTNTDAFTVDSRFMIRVQSDELTDRFFQHQDNICEAAQHFIFLA